MAQEQEMTFEQMQALTSEEQVELFHKLDKIRAVGKQAGYSLQYGAGVKTVARSCKVTDKVAKKLHAGYHKLNWSVAKISGMMVTKKTSFGEWQINPVNKFWYSLRTEKDKFSTLVQGTAAYVFDMWLYQCKVLAAKRGLDYKLVCQFHDDQALSLPIGMEEEYKALANDALKKMNDMLKLNVEIRCDVLFGFNGAEIH